MLCLDLLITLHLPFLSGKNRNLYYHLAAFGLTTASALLCNFEATRICDLQHDSAEGLLLIPLHFVFLQIGFVAIGLFSILYGIYCYRKDYRNEERRGYLARHLFTMFALVVVWLLPLANVEFVSPLDAGVYSLISDISFSLLLTSSLILNLVRLTQPYFRQAVLRAFLLRPLPPDTNDAWLMSLNQLVSVRNNQAVLLHLIASISAAAALDASPSTPYLQHALDYEQGSLKVQLTVYRPHTFAQLRERDGLGTDALQGSLDPEQNRRKLKESRESLGASGNFFFFSFDNKLVLKTVEKEQISSLLEVLDQIPPSGETLLNQYYGAFSLRINRSTEVHVLLLQNTLQPLLDQAQHLRIYDLKGSLINRETGHGPGALKDVDFLKSDALFIKMTASAFESLYRVLKQDTLLLASRGLMDYSLLLALAEALPEQPAHLRLVRSGSRTYCFSLIDCLQKFDFGKRLQYFAKTRLMGCKGEQLSCVQPSLYRRRFLEFVRAAVVIAK